MFLYICMYLYSKFRFCIWERTCGLCPSVVN
jgi:hypothetical protein